MVVLSGLRIVYVRLVAASLPVEKVAAPARHPAAVEDVVQMHEMVEVVQESLGWKAVGVCLDDFFQRRSIEDLFLKGARGMCVSSACESVC